MKIPPRVPSKHSQFGRFILVSPPSNVVQSSAQTLLNDEIVWHSSTMIIPAACATFLLLCTIFMTNLLEFPEYALVIGLGAAISGFLMGAVIVHRFDQRRSNRMLSEQEVRLARDNPEWSSCARSVLLNASPLMQRDLVNAAHVHVYKVPCQNMDF